MGDDMLKNKLKEIRMKEFMMNQKQFAEVLGIDPKKYSKYEKGVVPLGDMLLHIAKKLNRSVEDVFYLDD